LTQWFTAAPGTATLFIVEDAAETGEHLRASNKPYIVMSTRPAEDMPLSEEAAALYRSAKVIWCLEISQWVHLRRAYGIDEKKLCIVPWLALC
jgi:hypothetical protein